MCRSPPWARIDSMSPTGGLLPETGMTGPTLYGLPDCDICEKARNWLGRFIVGINPVRNLHELALCANRLHVAHTVGSYRKPA